MASRIIRGARHLLIAACMLAWAGGAAAAQGLPKAVAGALKAAGIPQSAVAAFVQPVDAGRSVLAFNAAYPLNPASVMKLVTTFAALELLGPAFTWKTEVYASAPLRGDVLPGDLVLRGGGDPKLVLEQLWLLVRALRARGLREIAGDLVLDRGYFAADVSGNGSLDGETQRPYNVAPDALLANFKSFRFTFVPDPQLKSVQVLVEPRSAMLQVANSVKLTDGPCNDWRARLRADFQNGTTSASAGFSGWYPSACGEKSWNVALLAHAPYLHGVFRQLWADAGGVLAGGMREAAVPADALLMYVAESPALAEIVRDINKYSNNVMARQLFLTLSAEMLGQPARRELSAQVVHGWLAQRGLAFPELVIDNGSGLSRHERISAGNLGRLLLAAWSSAVMPELVASMPLVATDGTMKRRLKFEALAGQAHIKTGSLADVRSIAGYVLDRYGRRYAVVFIVNHATAGASQGAIDAMLRWVHDGAGRTAVSPPAESQ